MLRVPTEAAGKSDSALLAWTTLSVFVGCFAIFCALRTQDILAVDGGNRCFEIYRNPRPYFDINNHLLHYVLIFSWTRLAALFGYTPNGPMQFFHLVTMMNCLAMAASLAIVFVLIFSAVRRWHLALLVTLGYGLTRAFLLQATNANEPPVGIFWSLLGVLFAALCFRVKSNWLVALSALLMAAAMAAYQTTILLFPAALYLIWQSRADENSEKMPRPTEAWTFRHPTSGQLSAFATFAASGLATTAVIFGFAYWHMGIRGASQMLQRFTQHEDAQTYMGLSVGRTLNVPVGFLSNMYPVLTSYAGLRALWHGPRAELIAIAALGAATGGVLLLITYAIWKNRQTLLFQQRIALQAAIIGLVFTSVPLFIWDPTYPKFWLQPFGCIAVVVAVGLQILLVQNGGVRQFARIGAAFLLIGVSTNLVTAIRDHRTKRPDMNQAEEIAQIAGPNDFVVGSWDGAALLYGEVYANKDRFLDFPEDAAFRHRRAISDLNDAVAATAKRGGTVYFIGLLEKNEVEWNDFLGKRCGVPYSDFEIYRNGSVRIRNFVSGNHEAAMWQFNPSANP